MASHILVVEDSELVTSAFRILLEDAGYRVSVAETMKQSVDAASRSPVDLMLLDLTLPDGNGLDGLAAMRASGSAPRITLAMTGDDNPDTRARCIEAGCADVLVKPVSIKELKRTIAALLS
ncbi:MAG: response regulator [Gemmatimonadota bacterium]|nr:response regulator [Gemmatimonadota bacterium]